MPNAIEWGPDEADQVLDALAATAGIDIHDDHRAGVAQFLSIARRQAQLLEQTPVPDGTLELAATYDPTPQAGS